jgi:hypothetical protein
MWHSVDEIAASHWQSFRRAYGTAAVRPGYQSSMAELGLRSR